MILKTSDFTFKFLHSWTKLCLFPSLKNAPQTKGQFHLTLVLPLWHYLSSLCLKFKACAGFKYTFFFLKSKTEMYYWTDNASRRPILVLSTSHSTFFVGRWRAFDCFLSVPLVLLQVSGIMLSNLILLLSRITQVSTGELVCRRSIWGKEFSSADGSIILRRLHTVLEHGRLSRSPVPFIFPPRELLIFGEERSSLVPLS